MFLEQEFYAEGFRGRMRMVNRKVFMHGQYSKTDFLEPSELMVFTNPHKNYTTIIFSGAKNLIGEKYFHEGDEEGEIIDISNVSSVRLIPGEELYIRRVISGERERAIALWMPLGSREFEL